MSEITQEESSGEASPRRAPRTVNELVGRWIAQGARAAVFLRPDWRGLRGSPLLVAVAFFASFTVALVQGRFYIAGGAQFQWRALGYGWLDTLVCAWACWMVLPAPAAPIDRSRQAGDAPTLYTLLFFQSLVLQFALACFYVSLMQAHVDFTRPLWHATAWLPLAWVLLAQGCLLWRSAASASPARRAVGVSLVAATTLANIWLFPFSYWASDRPAVTATGAGKAANAASAASDAEADAATDAQADAEPEFPMLKLSQGVFESQQRLLAAQLDAIQAQRAGTVDLYAITFAPYADVDVFMRESAVVSSVMESRFDARGRTLQLVNNVATVDRLAWATPENLHRTIARMAQRMDRDEDILFLHLTSHGGADGHLSAEFFPLTVDPLTPQMLRRWLDEAGVKHRVISISACFSGSWIASLANDDTLVMTAADADHTSYGCGSKSTLTFFGQAMYDEQLRHTWSFEAAHAASRKLIDERERAAGKSDGYSNPQIRVGPHIREKLNALEARLAASAAR